MSGRPMIGQSDVLLIIDVQNDFCPGGALPVPKGSEIVPILNRVARRFETAVLTQDWHPQGHISFASAHPGRRPFETIALAYGSQTLWPDHCVQEHPGADFHPDLKIPQAALVLRKGLHRDIDSYSAFQENDHKTATGLAGYLRERGLTRIFLAGLAYDVCVRYSAEDARAFGFDVVVLEDACRGLNIGGSMEQTRKRLTALGCAAAMSTDIVE